MKSQKHRFYQIEQEKSIIAKTETVLLTDLPKSSFIPKGKRYQVKKGETSALIIPSDVHFGI